jgi:hypothetical protein
MELWETGGATKTISISDATVCFWSALMVAATVEYASGKTTTALSLGSDT